MTVQEFVRQVAGFASKNHPEKIKHFGWFLHAHMGLSRFGAKEIGTCYDGANAQRPANLNRFLESLTEKQPPELLHDSSGYRLSQVVRDKLDRALGRSDTVIVVEKMLADLPGKIDNESERLFLAEALICYRNGALRAAIVMVWNLAYDHLARWVLSDAGRLSGFNNGIPKRNPKKAHIVVKGREDFSELKEDEMVDIVGGLHGFSADVKRILKEKLGRRNSYAHPSTLTIERSQVDDMITDLVNNVVLRLKV